MDTALPSTEEGIDAFIAAFEAGSLPKGRWTHGAHILTGACYVHALGEAGAIARMRERVAAYNVAVGGQNTDTGGYHETVTVFWIKILSGYCGEHSELGRAEFAARAVEHFVGQRDIWRRYYDYDVVGSVEARKRWVPPTLLLLP
jgi:hypothetical protein